MVTERWHGVPYGERPLARVREYVTLLKQCLSGESVTFDGDFYRTRKATIYDRPGEPLDLVGQAHRLIARAMPAETITLWRPVGPKELDLIRASGMRAFPPRLPEQGRPVRRRASVRQPFATCGNFYSVTTGWQHSLRKA